MNRHAGLSADRWKLDVSGSWKRFLLRATVACYDLDATENRAVAISMLIVVTHADDSSEPVSIGKSPHFQLTLFERKFSNERRTSLFQVEIFPASKKSKCVYLPGIGRLFVYCGRRVELVRLLAWFVAVVRGYSKKPRAARTRRERERREERNNLPDRHTRNHASERASERIKSARPSSASK